MADDKRKQLRHWLEGTGTRLYPLTFAQLELWEAAALPPAHVSNHISAIITIRGPVAAGLLQVAMERVVERHDSLRLSILPGKGRPVQFVRPRATPVLNFHEAAALLDRPEAVIERAREFSRRPFDLARQPLYRMDVLRRAADDHVLVWTVHHAIADGWSLGVFVSEVLEAYRRTLEGAGPGRPPPLSYGTWAAIDRAAWPADELSRRANFWRGQLAGAPRLWPDAAPVSGELLRRVGRVPENRTRAVRELARRSRATLFSTLFAVFQIALSRWTGAQDFVVGTPVAQRVRHDVRDVIGSFAGNVPLRGHAPAGLPFAEHLARVHASAIDCFAHAMPFVELVKAIGDPPTPRHHPAYQVRFALQNHPLPDVSLPSLGIQIELASTGTGRFDLGCEITAVGAALEVVWLFTPDRFDADAIVALESLFMTVLARACDAPDEPA